MPNRIPDSLMSDLYIHWFFDVGLIVFNLFSKKLHNVYKTIVYYLQIYSYTYTYTSAQSITTHCIRYWWTRITTTFTKCFDFLIQQNPWYQLIKHCPTAHHHLFLLRNILWLNSSYGHDNMCDCSLPSSTTNYFLNQSNVLHLVFAPLRGHCLSLIVAKHSGYRWKKQLAHLENLSVGQVVKVGLLSRAG